MFEYYPDCLNIVDMQEALHVGRSTAYQLIKNNKIRHKRIGGKIIIPKQYLIDFVENS